MEFTDLDPTKVKIGDKAKLDVNVDRLDPFSQLSVSLAKMLAIQARSTNSGVDPDVSDHSQS
jgi:hypothetical protein